MPQTHAPQTTDGFFYWDAPIPLWAVSQGSDGAVHITQCPTLMVRINEHGARAFAKYHCDSMQDWELGKAKVFGSKQAALLYVLSLREAALQQTRRDLLELDRTTE